MVWSTTRVFGFYQTAIEHMVLHTSNRAMLVFFLQLLKGKPKTKPFFYARYRPSDEDVMKFVVDIQEHLWTLKPAIPVLSSVISESVNGLVKWTDRFRLESMNIFRECCFFVVVLS